jgi:hypothetical protein
MNFQRAGKIMLPVQPDEKNDNGHTQYEGNEKKLLSCLLHYTPTTPVSGKFFPKNQRHRMLCHPALSPSRKFSGNPDFP